MCNLYGNRIPYSAYVAGFAELEIPLVSPRPEAAPNLQPLDEVRPTDPAPVIRAAPGGVELVHLRWGLAPTAPKRPPVINFRSEGRAFAQGRCLVPVSYFFEFTGTKYPKTRWRFTKAGEDWFCFAGFWRPDPADAAAARFTLLTTAPGPDVAPIHDRQPVVLKRSTWGAWLDPAEPADRLLAPSPAGTLLVEKAERQAAPSLI